MKIFNKVSVGVLVASLALVVAPMVAQAATAPSLGTASIYGIVSETLTNSNTSPQTIVNGSICGTTLDVPLPLTITGATNTPCDPQVGLDQDAALAVLNGQACTPIAGTLDAVIIGLNPPGTFPPGCYEVTGAMDITLSTTVTLDGSSTDVWVFRSSGALTTGQDSLVVLTGGANASNVFWAPVGATTLGANTAPSLVTPTFQGTIIDAAGISIGHFANLLGRALAFGGTVLTDANTISVPTVPVPAPPSGGSSSNNAPPPPPLINVTKIPDPLALPGGPGSVEYTYTATNIGQIAMSSVSVNDNKCSPVQFISGDSDNDAMLDVSESWVYRCTKTLSATETNTVTAQGSTANGTVRDTASATVVVSVPGLPNTGLLPPLIHLFKKPNVFVLPIGGGAVTYMYTVTNLGTEPLSDVSVTDDKCTGLPGRVVGHPGDLNQNNLLESNEAWSFTCQTYLTQTTTNTGTASGYANGLIAVDFSPATVVVASPTLPNTGIVSNKNSTLWNLIIPVGIFVALFSSYLVRRKWPI